MMVKETEIIEFLKINPNSNVDDFRKKFTKYPSKLLKGLVERKIIIKNVNPVKYSLNVQKKDFKTREIEKTLKPKSEKGVIEDLEHKIMSKILPILENYNQRLTILEKSINKNLKKIETDFSSKSKKIDENRIMNLLRVHYNEKGDKVGDMVAIPTIIEKIKKETGFHKKDIEEAIYKLFVKGLIDLQPGKARKGKPLKIDGYSFYWLKI